MTESFNLKEKLTFSLPSLFHHRSTIQRLLEVSFVIGYNTANSRVHHSQTLVVLHATLGEDVRLPNKGMQLVQSQALYLKKVKQISFFILIPYDLSLMYHHKKNR